MIYTVLTKTAMRIAYDAHKDQVDKTGIPYIYHPIHVAEQMNDEVTTCVALLHDVVEDTSLTFADLLKQGIPETVIEALKLLTHDKHVDYYWYVNNIRKSRNQTAIVVKLKDLQHNSDITRFDAVDTEARKLINRYETAIKTLRGEEDVIKECIKADPSFYIVNKRVVVRKIGIAYYTLNKNGEWTYSPTCVDYWDGHSSSSFADIIEIGENDIDKILRIGLMNFLKKSRML